MRSESSVAEASPEEGADCDAPSAGGARQEFAHRAGEARRGSR